MTEMIIDNGIVIDDAESVLCGIREHSNKQITDLGSVIKFINKEKNTKFYVDNNLNSSTQPGQNSIYIWLDTGYVDSKGNPIMISMIKGFSGYIGHMVGTLYMLAESARSFFKIKRAIMDQKIAAFKKKYLSKVKERKVEHIRDEQDYLISACNDVSEETELASKLRGLNIAFSVEKDDVEDVPGEIELEEEFSEEENEITIELLLEKMDSMQAYMDELLDVIKTMETENQSQISDLQAKNEEYKRVILQMRDFVQAEQDADELRLGNKGSRPGHDLLGDHSKILVIGGQNLGTNIMSGIAKGYGFDKKDFEFIDYDKAKDYIERVRRNGKYKAVIIGACPHKTTGSAGHSSALEMFRQTEGMPYTADARSKSGKLKVTKESFREALACVCDNLRLAYAS